MRTPKMAFRSARAACLAAAALFTLANAPAALAGEAAPAAPVTRPPAPTLGVVDTDLLVRDSLAAKAIRTERDKYAQTYQNQVKEMEAALRKEDQELAQQRGVLSPDVFQQRAQAFQQKLADFQAQLRDKQERLEFAFQQAMQEIGNMIMVVSGEVAQQRGVNAVMARSQMMIFDPSMDITKPVLDLLNQRLPTVAVQNPDTLQRTQPNGEAPAAPAAAPATKKP